MFVEYGDDSVAQLGGVHLACEGVSNVLTKLLEWGRLMAYLEQSTRYVPYADRPGGRWRYHVPAEVRATPLAREFEATLDLMFETYARWLEPMQEHFRRRHPRQATDSEAVYRSTIRAKALDTLRGLLPAATKSNVGLYGTGQAYEALLLRLRASPLAEARACADLALTELRKVIPAFLRRVDTPDRGGAWSAYLAATREATEAAAAGALGRSRPSPRPEVALTDFDPEGEVKVVAAALYAVSGVPDDQLLAHRAAHERQGARGGPRGLRRGAARTGATSRAALSSGRATGSTSSPTTAPSGTSSATGSCRSSGSRCRSSSRLRGAGRDRGGGRAAPTGVRVMEASAALTTRWPPRASRRSRPMPSAMAYRIRFYMEMNAREAMHVLELRTAPQGHPAYRRVCQAMHRLIAEEAGHRGLAAAMRFVDHSAVELERLEAERRTDARRRALSETGSAER